MEEAKEITITLKDEARRLTHKELVYENVTVSSLDPVIQNCIMEAKKSFEGQPDSVKVKITLEL